MFAMRALKRIPLLVAALVAFNGCNSRPAPEVKQEVVEKVEQPAATPETKSAADPNAKSAATAKPVPAEVRDVGRRIFRDAAVVEASHDPYFVVGDFNGDQSQDIAIVIKPAEGKLSEINQANPPWIVKDPFNPNLPPQLRSEPLQIKEGETLLAIVHGFDAGGWRNPEATQTYLLKEGAGTNIRVQSAKASLAKYAGKPTPTVNGDTISEMLRNTQGFLYFSGASYSWYDPGTFKPEPDRRMAHMPAPAPNKGNE